MKWSQTALTLLLVFTACGDGGGEVSNRTDSTPLMTSTTTEADISSNSEPTTDTDQLYPDVVEVEVTKVGNEYRFEVTIRSPYDSPARYADAWRVKGPDGEIYGVRELLHDHAAEQPFTRSLDGVEIPDTISLVIVEGRDLVNGWGGKTMEVVLPD